LSLPTLLLSSPWSTMYTILHACTQYPRTPNSQGSSLRVELGTRQPNSPLELTDFGGQSRHFIFSAVECISSSYYDSPCLTLGFYSAVAIAKPPSLVSSTRRFGRFVPVPPYFSPPLNPLSTRPASERIWSHI